MVINWSYCGICWSDLFPRIKSSPPDFTKSENLKQKKVFIDLMTLIFKCKDLIKRIFPDFSTTTFKNIKTHTCLYFFWQFQIDSLYLISVQECHQQNSHLVRLNLNLRTVFHSIHVAPVAVHPLAPDPDDQMNRMTTRMSLCCYPH